MYNQKPDDRPDVALTQTELGIYSHLLGAGTVVVNRKTKGVVGFYDNWAQARIEYPLIALGTHPEFVGHDLSKIAPAVPGYKIPAIARSEDKKPSNVIIVGDIADFLIRESKNDATGVATRVI